MILEAMVAGYYDKTTRVTRCDKFFAWCCLVLVFSSKRLNHLQHFGFEQLMQLVNEERVTPHHDKGGCIDGRFFWLTNEDCLLVPWLHYGPSLAPKGRREKVDYLIPKPKNAFTVFSNKPACPVVCSKWLVRLFTIAGYTPELAWKKRRVHGLRRTLISYGCDLDVADEKLRRLAGWADEKSLRHYTSKSKQILKTKAGIVKNKRQEVVKKYMKRYEVENGGKRVPTHKRMELQEIAEHKVTAYLMEMVAEQSTK